MLRPYVSQRLDHGVRDLVERDGATQRSGERRCSARAWRRAAHGCDDVLCPVEQDGSMLQECASLPDLRRAHQLAAGDEYLAADGSREARRRMVEHPGGWWRSMGRQGGIGTEGLERSGDTFMDGVVRAS